MALNWISSRTVSALPLVGIGLALANWNARPAAAWAWTAAIVTFAVMVAVQRRSQLASSRSPGDAASVRGVASVADAVVFGDDQGALSHNSNVTIRTRRVPTGDVLIRRPSLMNAREECPP
jgi:hypothetical protein